jgi:hypothetical protein
MPLVVLKRNLSRRWKNDCHRLRRNTQDVREYGPEVLRGLTTIHDGVVRNVHSVHVPLIGEPRGFEQRVGVACAVQALSCGSFVGVVSNLELDAEALAFAPFVADLADDEVNQAVATLSLDRIAAGLAAVGMNFVTRRHLTKRNL